uniref:Methyltransferase domain-containing protein n=1 Tax=Pseudomonas fluorescens TaxID=294 RepID=Q8RSY2_PSEFL|nr:unknown [Pseudomonas fluorescens]
MGTNRSVRRRAAVCAKAQALAGLVCGKRPSGSSPVAGRSSIDLPGIRPGADRRRPGLERASRPAVTHCLQDVMAAVAIGPEHTPVALHACGDLHVRLLHLASAAGCKQLALAPCCYNRINAQAYQPLSSAGRASPLQLSIDDLGLPLSETVTAGKRVRLQRDTSMARRLGFDQLQRQLRGCDEYLSTPSLPAKLAGQALRGLLPRAGKAQRVIHRRTGLGRFRGVWLATPGRGQKPGIGAWSVSAAAGVMAGAGSCTVSRRKRLQGGSRHLLRTGLDAAQLDGACRARLKGEIVAAHPVDNSVDEFFTEPVAIYVTGQKPGWSFFVHKIKRTQNRQLRRDENASTQRLFRDIALQPIVHKHLALSE